MVDIVGVKFRPSGKIYYFDPINFDIKEGDNVIVETSRGVEYGNVVLGRKHVNESVITKPLKGVIRLATEDDTVRNAENKNKEKQAFSICLEKIKQHKLAMKLVEVEYTFDGNKILFYFTSEGRVDFRDLVKDLATVFRTRIELRQIGVRDESKVIGSVGACGRGLCCSLFLDEFMPVSIKMAKDQGLSLNPAKISGACGRLMCCLKYEQDMYEEMMNESPKPGASVKTPGGEGVVDSVSLIRGLVKVKLADESETTLREFKINEVKPLKHRNADTKQNRKEQEKS